MRNLVLAVAPCLCCCTVFGQELTSIYRAIEGGQCIRMGTFRVSNQEAVAAYENHPWSKIGALDFLDAGSGPQRRVGFGDNFEFFLRSHYESVGHTQLGSACSDAGFVTYRALCAGGLCMLPPTTCTVTSFQVVGIWCPGECGSGNSCARTSFGITGIIGSPRLCPCNLFCLTPYYPNPTGVVIVTNGPLCSCQSQPASCSPLGPGDLTGGFVVNCVTIPRIGSVFSVSIGAQIGATQNYLFIGASRTTPIEIDPRAMCPNATYPLPGLFWLHPVTLIPSGSSPLRFDINIPNEASLVGVTMGLQGVSPYAPAGCWYAGEAIRVTIQA